MIKEAKETKGVAVSDYNEGFMDAYNDISCSYKSDDYIRGYRRGLEVRTLPCTDPNVVSAVRARAAAGH